MAIADAPPVAPSAADAREALAVEWTARAPQSADEILDFYRTSEKLGDDLEAFHREPERIKWTELLVHVARQIEAKSALDIGCGVGHDLRAMRLAHPDMALNGVEPNWHLRIESGLAEDIGGVIYGELEGAPVEDVDLLSCFDVLEHIPDPEVFLAQIASRAKLGAVLVETCATHDLGTPLHLKANRGWRTGRCMELYGWEKVAETGRARVWQRMAQQNRLSTSIIPIVFRSISMQTHKAITHLLTHDAERKFGWRELLAGEAGLFRARNIAVSTWYTSTADDVFLMVDDDIVFTPEDAEHMVTMCREGHDVIAAAYPVRDGGHLAIRALAETDVRFGEGQPPVEVRHAGTGFFAVHRRVLDALIPTLPLCHAANEWAYWPVFSAEVVEDEQAGGFNVLTEDYHLCEMVRALGFKVWIDPSVRLGHLGMIPITLANMGQIHAAIKGGN